MRRIPGMMKRSVYIAVVSLIVAHSLPPLCIGQEILLQTQKVFDKYYNRVVKIQVVEKDSGAKAVIGSGFFVSPYGHIITNYHVISNLILHHDRYRAEMIETAGATQGLSVKGIDVINDLALVKAEVSDTPFFRIADREPQQGTRLYSMGFPHDIGLSIVEGTYNGLMKYALYKKIHFTAPINPGMSGGPTINSSGEVVGVNVSTMAQEISFLVPTEAVARLMRLADAEKKDPRSFLDDIRSQILAHQDIFFPDNLMRSGETVRIGDYSLPGQLSPSFKCWGDSKYPEQFLYHSVNHSCSTDDYMFISSEHSSGIIRFSHRYITNDGMNNFRFNHLYSESFQQRKHYLYGDEEEVTRFECKSGTLSRGEIIFKTAFCARGYKKLKGLYDVVFKVAILSSENSGIETELEISGVSFEKAVSLTKGYVEMIRWGK